MSLKLCHQALHYIDNHLESKLKVSDVSKELNCSSVHLHRIFKKYISIPVKEHIRLRQLSQSVLDLKHTEMNVLDIAFQYGYESTEAYSRAFRRYFGILPSQYRMNNEALEIYEQNLAYLHDASHHYDYKDVLPLELYIASLPKLTLVGVENSHHIDPREFYQVCQTNGTEALINSIENVLFGCGACLNYEKPYSNHFYGVAVSDTVVKYDALSKHVFDGSEYLVCYSPPYSPEDHGHIIKSAWQLLHSSELKDYEYNFDHAPVLECDDELGYKLMLPIRRK